MELQLGSNDEFFLRIIRSINLSEERKEEALISLNEDNLQLNELNGKLFEQAIKLAEDKPEDLIELVRTSLMDAKNLSTLFAIHHVLSKTEKSVSDKMKIIAVAYELTALFKLGSYLLSDNKAPVHSLKKPQNILKPFKRVGMNIEVDLIRKIRNANNHKFAIRKDLIIDDENKEILSVYELESIFKDVNRCINWYIKFLSKITLYIPKFGLLVLHTAYHEITEKKEEYADYYEGLKLIAPEIFQKKERVVETEPKFDNSFPGLFKKLKNKVKDALTFKFTVHIKSNRNRMQNPELYKRNIKEIEFHIQTQLEIVKNLLLAINLNLDNQDEKDRIIKSINILEEKKSKWIYKLKTHIKRI
jgi:hypothetical protein